MTYTLETIKERLYKMAENKGAERGKEITTCSGGKKTKEEGYAEMLPGLYGYTFEYADTHSADMVLVATTPEAFQEYLKDFPDLKLMPLEGRG